MLCPYCGKGEQRVGAYCRSCGEWLTERGSRRARSDTPGQRMTAMIVFNALSVLFALASVITLWATYLGKPEAKWSIYLAGAFCIVIAVHQCLSLAFALDLKIRSNRARKGLDAYEPFAVADARPLQIAAGLATSQLIDQRDMPSVTEETTDLLPRRADTNPGLDKRRLRPS